MLRKEGVWQDRWNKDSEDMETIQSIPTVKQFIGRNSVNI